MGAPFVVAGHATCCLRGGAVLAHLVNLSYNVTSLSD
jgi:hypothetical protein